MPPRRRGWPPVRRGKCGKNKKLEPRPDSIGPKTALGRACHAKTMRCKACFPALAAFSPMRGALEVKRIPRDRERRWRGRRASAGRLRRQFLRATNRSNRPGARAEDALAGGAQKLDLHLHVEAIGMQQSLSVDHDADMAFPEDAVAALEPRQIVRDGHGHPGF